MKNRRSKTPRGNPGVELLDSAVHLLRQASPGDYLCYLAGAAPFTVGLLYFWADMSRNAYAFRYASAAAFGMALLFVWMKAWQAVFAGRLWARVLGVDPSRLTLRRFGRIYANQAMIQPWGFVLLPLSFIATLPFVWVFAFYQNAVVLDEGDPPRNEGPSLAARAMAQAKLWAHQNQIVVMLLTLFWFVVLLNIFIAAALLPHLVKMILGVETIFVRSGVHFVLNTTFLMTVFMLTYVCWDPLAKAAYVLRCYYGESLSTGDDIRVEFRRIVSVGQRAAAVVILAAAGALAVFAFASSASAQPPPPPPPPQTSAPTVESSVEPGELDNALSEVIEHRKYAWRMPREGIEKPEGESLDMSPIEAFFDGIGTMIVDALKFIGKGLEKIGEWIDKLFGNKPKAPTGGGGLNFGFGFLRFAMYILLGTILVVAAILIFRLVREWRSTEVIEASADEPEAPKETPDVADETVTAADLPEDEWLKVARDLWDRGERRLALRALYLATLAALGRQGLVSLARHKSNREYMIELRRRAHAVPDVLDQFDSDVATFERVWYGRDDATPEAFDQVRTGYERINRDAP